MAFTYETTEIPEGIRDTVNLTGVDIPRGSVITGSSSSGSLPAAKSDPVYGVTSNVVKNGQHGAVVTRGKVQVLAGSGGFPAGVRLMPEPGGTGCAIPWAAAAGANASVLGNSMTAALAGALGECELAGPGSMAQG